MDGIILSGIIGIIGVISTIATAFISPIVAKNIADREKRKYVPFAKVQRRDSLYGKWIGTLDQETGLEKLHNKHKLTIEFLKDSTPITGLIKIRFVVEPYERIIPPDNTIDGNVENTIYDGHILKTDYVNKNNNAIHFGTLYGMHSPDGTKIDGYFLGFGLISKQFVTGQFHLKKEDYSNFS